MEYDGTIQIANTIKISSALCTLILSENQMGAKCAIKIAKTLNYFCFT